VRIGTGGRVDLPLVLVADPKVARPAMWGGIKESTRQTVAVASLKRAAPPKNPVFSLKAWGY
jgi:hypothetical protein